MPIDPSIIAQGVKPVQINDPLEQYSNMLRAQYMGTQNQLGQQDIATKNAMNQAFSNPNSTNPDGTLNLLNIRANLGTAGGNAFPGIAEHAMAMRAQQATMAKAQAEATKERIAQGMNQVAHIDPTDPNALQTLQGINTALAPDLASLGVDANKENQRAADLSTNPAAWSTYLKTHSLIAEQLLKMERPTLVGQGSQQTVLQTHMYDTGQPPTVAAVLPVGVSPNAQLAASVALQGQSTVAGTARAVAHITAGAAQQRLSSEQATTTLRPLYTAAQNARVGIAYGNKVADLIDQGAIVGPGAPLRTAFARIGAQLGIDVSKAANSDEIAKILAQGVATQAGSIQGLKNFAGPEIKLIQGMTPQQIQSPEGIRAIIRLSNGVLANNVTKYTNQYGDIQNRLPQGTVLTLPPVTPVPPDIRPEELNGPTPADITKLKARPDLAHQQMFDRHFGNGEAVKALGAQ